jgi:glycerol-3-phosphate dehydrogenase (NAD(P)+)
LAGLLAEKGLSVSLWEFDPAAAEHLRTTRSLKTLPELSLAPSVDVTGDLKTALSGRDWVLSVTPSAFVRSTMRAVRASGALSPQAKIISASKGIEDKTLKRMSEIISEETGVAAQRIGVLSGPSHAEEVCRRMPTAVVAAAADPALAESIQKLFAIDYFRVYTQSDVTGVELAGTLKNVLAIGCGISDGLGFGDNTRAALLTRGLNEMARIGVKSGGQQMTFYGLAGMGDLIVTCLSKHSRNRGLGEKIGKGLTPKQALGEMTMVAEGMVSAPAAQALAQKLGVDCPLIREIYNVLYEAKDPKRAVQELFSREAKGE